MAPRKPRGKVGQFVKTMTDEDFANIPQPPQTYSEEAQIMWYRIWHAGSGWLTPADYLIITEICELSEEKAFYRLALQNTRRINEMSNGALQKHPYLELLASTRKELNGLLGVIGFTPKDRASIGAMEDMVDDPFREYMKRKLADDDARREAMANEEEADF